MMMLVASNFVNFFHSTLPTIKLIPCHLIQSATNSPAQYPNLESHTSSWRVVIVISNNICKVSSISRHI